MSFIRVVSPQQAGEFIDSRMTRAGFREGSPLAQLVRPGNIAAGLGRAI
jgi:hypothetical protein